MIRFDARSAAVVVINPVGVPSEMDELALGWARLICMDGFTVLMPNVRVGSSTPRYAPLFLYDEARQPTAENILNMTHLQRQIR
jgi:hypothetical protein